MGNGDFEYTPSLVQALLLLLASEQTSIWFAEYRADLSAALNRVPYPYAHALVLHFTYGYTAKEIERILLGAGEDWDAGGAMIAIGLALVLGQLNGRRD